MKQSIQLRLGQNLTMTPQLQQAIRLLQLSSLELSSEIQEALESNPMLEIAEGDSEEGPGNPQNDSNDEKEDRKSGGEGKGKDRGGSDRSKGETESRGRAGGERRRQV